MINLYCLPNGVHAPASSLTEDEAVELHRSGRLQASDYPLLRPEAAVAVAIEMEERVRANSRRTVVFWGVLTPRHVLSGRA